MVPTYYPAVRYGGPIRSVHGLCRALAAGGHHVEVYTTSVDGPRRLDVPEGAPIDVEGVCVRYFRSRFDRLYWSPQMRRALDDALSKFDLVHLHSVYLWPTAAAARMARVRGVPYVLSPRGMLVPELISAKSSILKRAWINLIESRNLRFADRLHMTSRQEFHDLVRCGLALAPVVEIPNGVDFESEYLRCPVPGHVLYLGRISWKKNLFALVNAICALPNASLTLAGPDEEALVAPLLEQARLKGAVSRVRWVGQVGSSAKKELFSSAALTVLPSFNENFGNVVVEAMAQGCPVMVTPEVGARCVVEDCGGGWVAAGTGDDQLREALSNAFSDPQRAEERGANARRYVRSELSWSAVATRMSSLYRSVLSERGN